MDPKMDFVKCIWQKYVAPEVCDVIGALARAAKAAHGRAFLVGGCVRDWILEQPANDLDLEVFGMAPERLEAVLRRFGRFDAVGKAFGVYKMAGLPLDVSLPRRERKTGRGHRGFDVVPDPSLPLRAAAERRDFTINAILLDPLTDVIEDPCGGLTDLRERRLRHTSAAFAEDPLRVLRGMQFVARFSLRPDPATVALCRTIDAEGLARERCFEEWRKLLLLGARPSAGLAFLRDTGWVAHTPELAALIDCPQDPEWHPEGDAWDHTLHCLDAFAACRTGDAYEDIVVGLAVLCHDFGKPLTTAFTEGRWRSPGHESAGEAPTRSFLARLTNQTALIEDVVKLVVAHMRPMALRSTEAGPAAIRRLARDVGRLDRLLRVVEADGRGRPPLDEGDVAPWLRARAESLAVERAAPKPLVRGRDLLPHGFEPGPALGQVLRRLFEEQLDGRIESREEGVARALQIKEEMSA